MSSYGQTGDIALPFVAFHVPIQMILLTEHEPANQTGELLDLHVHHVDMPLETR